MNMGYCLSILETKKQTEFELLLSGNDLPKLQADTYPLAQILQQRLEDTISAEVDSALQHNLASTAIPILQNLCSKIPSTVFTKYERAGKNYVIIDHTLGDSGNLFFSGIFEKTSTKSPKHHTVIQQNKICFIFRQ
jgi:hypothetical protein